MISVLKWTALLHDALQEARDDDDDDDNGDDDVNSHNDGHDALIPNDDDPQ